MLHQVNKNVTKSATMGDMKDLARVFISIAALLFVGFGFLLARSEFNDPENVFYGMIETSLSTQGVSRTVEQETNGQNLKQIVQLQTGQENTVAGKTELSQGSGEDQTTIVTESAATPTEDFVRYAVITTSQLGASGQPLDFSNVIGVWGRTPLDTSVQRGGELFSEASLGIVPFGQLDAPDRQALLSKIRELDVYGIDFSNIESKRTDGRPTYVYHAEIKPDRYIEMLQQFGTYIGTSQLDNLIPSNFASNQPIKIDFEVDVWSRQLTKATFVDSERMESYAAYGLKNKVAIPEDSIPVSELQQLLQSVQ